MMIQHLAWRAGLLASLLAAGALVTACSGPGPDPGNHRLRALAADPIFSRLPPGAVRTSWQETPAQNAGLLGGGWHNPYVTLTFTSTQSVVEVFRFYAQRAAKAGWTPEGKLFIGLVDSWKKGVFGKRSWSDAVLMAHFNTNNVSLTGTGTPRNYSLQSGF